jgi:hypothetical protein
MRRALPMSLARCIRFPGSVVVLMGGLLALALPEAVIAQERARAPLLGTPVGPRMLGQPAVERPARNTGLGFMDTQLRHHRVLNARDAARPRLIALFNEHGLAFPPAEIFIRVFKHERLVEVWARSEADAELALVREYAMCEVSGRPGPKRFQGDLQIPEGVYYIDEFNPRSAYHLSLGLNYPNLSDRLRSPEVLLGGDIYIHGGCETVGCVPIEDHNIAELYWIAAQASEAGQTVIPVHIFPARLDPDRLQWLEETFRPERDLLTFWHNLAEGYAFFEESRRVPWVTVSEDGRYVIPERPRVAADGEAEPTPDQPGPPAGDDPRDGSP